MQGEGLEPLLAPGEGGKRAVEGALSAFVEADDGVDGAGFGEKGSEVGRGDVAGVAAACVLELGGDEVLGCEVEGLEVEGLVGDVLVWEETFEGSLDDGAV